MKNVKKPPIGNLQVDTTPFLQKGDFLPATLDERTGQIVIRDSVSYWQDAWRRLKGNIVAMIALGIIVLMALFAFAGPMIIPYTYDKPSEGRYEDLITDEKGNMLPQYKGLEKGLNLDPMAYSQVEKQLMNEGHKVFPHVAGTDIHGRDYLVRVMIGTRMSMTIGVVAALLVLVIGSIYGAISGYVGGRVDMVMMRIAEIVYSIPEILVVLLLAITMKDSLISFATANRKNAMGQFVIALGPSIIAIFCAFALLYWVSMARIIRGQVLQLKQQEFVLAAKALGASNGRIIRKHLLPNCIGAMVAATCLQIPSAIFLESFLSYLGLGVDVPMTSLGDLASTAVSGGVVIYPHRLLIPALVLSLMILSFNLFGDGLRDALDPRLKN